jgi:DAACS family dicarboxylate/amino acid:cation (Na+ or H+) symporter
MLVIKALRALSVPLVALLVFDALLRFELPSRGGWRMISVCGVNAVVAAGVALSLFNVFSPGIALRGLHLRPDGDPSPPRGFGAISALDTLVPKGIMTPFVENDVLGATMIALLIGLALRQMRAHGEPQAGAVEIVERVVHALLISFQRALAWLVRIMPWAVSALTAERVAQSGLEAFRGTATLVGVVALGLVLHGLVYYPLVVALFARMRPTTYLRHAWPAVLSGVAANSSLIAIPDTLSSLRRLLVSERSARLSVCLGTNFNNDGITLYEMLIALTMVQASGVELSILQQLAVASTALAAALGAAGIPEAGLIVLPSVLATVGLTEPFIAAALSCVLPIDWLLARGRSGLNVLSDIEVAILVDAESRPGLLLKLPYEERGDTR